MTLKHSPGPWNFDVLSEYVRSADGKEIADLMSHYRDGLLIAAAPDILRLLRVVCDQRNTWEELIAAIDEGRGVIARLDGDT